MKPDSGSYYHEGQRVTWFYTTDRRTDRCPYCADGRCEQRVETCPAWTGDVVVHDRPRLQ